MAKYIDKTDEYIAKHDARVANQESTINIELTWGSCFRLWISSLLIGLVSFMIVGVIANV